MADLSSFATSPGPQMMEMSLEADDVVGAMDMVTEVESLLLTTLVGDNVSFEMSAPATRDPLYIVIPITVLYSVIFFTGVVGNVVTCIVISRNKHMHTATNYYLFSLAVSDLLLLVSGLPQEMHFIWSRYPYVFGEAFCILRGLAAETSANATVLTITAFTVERYVAICHPFLSHTMSKLSRAVKLILVIWVVALAFAIPQAIQFGLWGDTPDRVVCIVKKVVMKHSFEISTFLFFVTPMTLITVLYALIGLRLRRSSMMKKSAGSFSQKKSTHTLELCASGAAGGAGASGSSVGGATGGSRHYQSQSSRRVLKMLGVWRTNKWLEVRTTRRQWISKAPSFKTKVTNGGRSPPSSTLTPPFALPRSHRRLRPLPWQMSLPPRQLPSAPPHDTAPRVRFAEPPTLRLPCAQRSKMRRYTRDAAGELGQDELATEINPVITVT